MKYITKPDRWFNEGTEAILVDDLRSPLYPNYNCGIFEGWTTCENPLAEGKHLKVDEVYWSNELCNFDDFEIVE